MVALVINERSFVEKIAKPHDTLPQTLELEMTLWCLEDC